MLIVDTHVHIYPAYDVAVALDCAFRHLTGLASSTQDTSYALLLTERYDCHFFRDLASQQVCLPPDFSVAPGPEQGSLLISEKAHRQLWLFAGRQVVTVDGIEVLALLTTGDYPDRQDTRETIQRIRADGGIPVLSWAPGKWLGRRGRVITRLIEEKAGGDLLAIGDTSMRPRGLPMPSLMRSGLPVLAGSDPLPFAGDEVSTGRYATCLRTFDAQAPVSSLRAAITAGELTMLGRRDSLPRMLTRWLRNQRVRKAVV